MVFVLALARFASWLMGLVRVSLGAIAVGFPAYSFGVWSALSYAARLLRIGVVTGLLIAAVNAFAPPNLSIQMLWDTYTAEGAPYLRYVEYFVPLDMLWVGLDWLVFASLVILTFRMVKWFESIW